MFKKKFGLEKSDDFQSFLRQARIELKNNPTIPKRDKSLDSKDFILSEDVIHLNNDGIFDMEVNSDHLENHVNHDISSPIQNKSKIRLKNMSHHRILKQSTVINPRLSKSNILNSSLNAKMLKKNSLLPLQKEIKALSKLDCNVNCKSMQSSPLSNHMEKISSIIGDGFKQACNRVINDSKLSPDGKTLKIQSSLGSPFVNDDNMLRNSFDVTHKIQEANEEYECEFSSPSQIDKLSLLESKANNGDQEEIVGTEHELNEEEIDGINFISILMYVDGEDNGLNIANDQQFEEICKLMTEYYGFNEKKYLNKYEVWKKYIKNLRLKKRFDERAREGDITQDSVAEK